MADRGWREECGVMGVWNSPEAARLSYLGLYAMQHRGQESAGIVTLSSGQHITHKGLGLVGDVFRDGDLERLKGIAAIGHVRYSTTGENLISNAQPLTADLFNGPVAVAHNGNIVNSEILRQELKRQGSIFHATSDTEVILHLISKNPSNDLLTAVQESLCRLEGAYSVMILAKDALIAARDPYGFRPLVLGKKRNLDGTWARVVASESCAFDLIGAEYEREVAPGEIFWIDGEGEHSRFFSRTSRTAHCVFEHIYFARPDSVVFGESVYETRKAYGRQLAMENPVEADVVVPVPDSGVAAALGYSAASGIPFELGIIRNHYVGRTFIQPQQSIRDFGVKIKLNPQSAVLKGKKVIVIDDSLVRGTTSRKIINLIRQAGAQEVHLKIAAPPTTGPCYYGVDTPQKTQLIAAQQTVEQIRNYVEADTLSYLSIEGLFKAMNRRHNEFCAACFDGQYPTPLFGRETGA